MEESNASEDVCEVNETGQAYGNILVPTSGSKRSVAAGGHGLELARQYDATVHGLYVVEHDSVTEPHGFVERRADEVDIEQRLKGLLERVGEDRLDQLRRRAAARDVEFRGEIRYGRPHKEIVDYVDEWDIDLVVMGTGTKPKHRRRRLGSTTQNVLCLTETSVLTVSTPLSL